MKGIWIHNNNRYFYLNNSSKVLAVIFCDVFDSKTYYTGYVCGKDQFYINSIYSICDNSLRLVKANVENNL